MKTAIEEKNALFVKNAIDKTDKDTKGEINQAEKQLIVPDDTPKYSKG